MFKQRIGLDPHRNGRETGGANGCPDIWELEDGNFAVIGAEKTAALRPKLPLTAGCGPDEGIIVIPRELLVEARGYIPED